MKYKVETKEEVRITYLVTASSEEEAEELVASGEFDNILSEDTNGLEFENITEFEEQL